MATNFTTQTRYAKVWARLAMIGHDFVEKWQHFSLRLTLYNTAWWIGNYCAPLRRLQFWATRRLTAWTDAYMERTYPDIMMRLANAIPSTAQVAPEDYNIWVFWWQGEEAMPELVRGCYRQLCRHNTNVVLITKDNFQHYCHIPEAVVAKAECSAITLTAFSDVIRVSLLEAHGGFWVDSTCWTSGKQPEAYRQYAIYSPRFKDVPAQPQWSNSRWVGYCLGTNLRHSIPFTFMKEAICAVVADSVFPFYLFIDYLYDLAYRKNPHVKAMFDAIPENNVQRGLLHTHIEHAFDQNTYNALCQNTWVFKLSYKSPWRAITAEGKPTFYAQLFKHDTED